MRHDGQAGASDMNGLELMLSEARFERVSIVVKEESREVIAQWMPGSGAEEFVVSANITAFKPEAPVTPSTCEPAKPDSSGG